MKTMKSILLALLSIAAAIPAGASIKLPNVLNDNMILQRESNVKLLG